jgi:putative membrane protein
LSAAAVGFTRAGSTFILTFAAAVLSSFVIAGTARLSDRTSIATFRRSMAAVFVGEMVWFVCSALGLVYASFQPSSHSAGNSVVFGGFLCAGFEFLVISGAFIERSSVSAILTVVHPLATTAVFLVSGAAIFDTVALVPGLLAFLIAAMFTPILRLRRTSRGYSSVKLFQAFMKTWANNDASDLESVIDAHASRATVSSKVFRFRKDDGDTLVVLPGVHPGPFYPVGSYNLPGLISHSFEGLGRVLTLHRPGGHENNLSTNASARRYADELRKLAENVRVDGGVAMIKGPLTTKIGKATASACIFGSDLLLTVSFAPYGSDDMETEAEKNLTALATPAGYDFSLVDAHNSIDEGREKPDLQNEGWADLIKRVSEAAPRPFRMGYAHSKETDFVASGDITTNGMALTLFEVGGTKWALVLADANNAVSTLRQAVATALEAGGFSLLEFCTSDSHDLAARGLTVDRGYRALGEATPLDSIVAETVRLARLAESRLAVCKYGSGKLTSEVSVFGSEALDEFASITRRNSRFARAYAAASALSIAVLLGAALVL